MTRRYLGVQEAAIYLGLTETAIRQRIKRGNIPFIRDGVTVRFDMHDLDRYMAAHKVVRTGEAEHGEDDQHRSSGRGVLLPETNRRQALGGDDRYPCARSRRT